MTAHIDRLRELAEERYEKQRAENDRLIEQVWQRANNNERFGMKVGLFPAWVREYALSSGAVARLIERAEEEVDD